MASQSFHRLVPELIPRDLWGRSAHQMLKGKSVWTKRIRADAIAIADGRCQICSDRSAGLVCHEKWNYDDKSRVATLIGFEVHCKGCDVVTHVGRATQLGDPREVLMQAVATLCNVNRCNPDTAMKMLSEAFDLWTLRSKGKWEIAIAPKLLKAYPELQPLETFKPR